MEPTKAWQSSASIRVVSEHEDALRRTGLHRPSDPVPVRATFPMPSARGISQILGLVILPFAFCRRRSRRWPRASRGFNWQHPPRVPVSRARVHAESRVRWHSRCSLGLKAEEDALGDLNRSILENIRLASRKNGIIDVLSPPPLASGRQHGLVLSDDLRCD